MPRKRYSPEEIIHKLREAEILLSQGHTVKETARKLEIADTGGGKTMEGWTRARRATSKTWNERMPSLKSW